MSTGSLGGFGRASLPQRRQDRVERSDRRWRRSSFAQAGLHVAAARRWRRAGIWFRQRMQKVVIRGSLRKSPSQGEFGVVGEFLNRFVGYGAHDWILGFSYPQ